MPQHSALGQIIRQIREILRETHYVMMTDARLLMEQAYTLLTLEDPNTPDRALYASDLAYTVAAMIECTQDQSFVKLGLGMLLRLGPMGELLAVAILYRRSVSFEVLLAIISSFPAQEQLCLCNQILRDPHPSDPRLHRWANESVKNLQGENPDDALLYLQSMPSEEEHLSYPMQRSFLSSRFGLWLHRLLALDLDFEQLSFMVDTAGRLGSNQVAGSLARRLKSAETRLLPILLDAIGRCAEKKNERLAKTLLPFLKHDSPDAALAALRALRRMHADQFPAGLAFLLHANRVPRNELALLLLDATLPEFKLALKRTPAVERRDLLLTLLAYVSGQHLAWIENALTRLKGKGAGHDWQALHQALKEYLAPFRKARPAPAFSPGRQRPGPAQSSEFPDSTDSLDNLASGASGILSRIKRTLNADEDVDPSQLKEFKLLEALSRGDVAEKSAFQRLNLPGAALADATYSRVTFLIVDFTGARFSKLRFERCLLKHVDFDAAQLDNVVFADCELINCRFSGAKLNKVRFERCTIQGAQFPEARVEEMDWLECAGADLDFSGAVLRAWRLNRCRLRNAHFAYASLRQTAWDGVELDRCRFSRTHFEKGSIRNATASCCVFSLCRCYELDTDEPGLLRQESQTALLDFALAAPTLRLPEPSPQLGSAEGLALMEQLLERWFFERDAKRRQYLFFEVNARRKAWAACMLGDPASGFLKLLPTLIEIGGALSTSEGQLLVPPCRIDGFQPDYSAIALLREHGFDPQALEAPKKRELIPVEALFTFGSTGTIAQARSSDIDLWVCYDAAKVPAPAARRLHEKLDALERWAASTFGLEVHFFLMEMDHIRENNFGFADKESAGSTQARLLKEEFYRTAVRLAGKWPAWLYFRPGLSQEAYLLDLDKLYSAGSLPNAKRFLDFGNLVEIPREEFFGASLWQIVKAMKSPFKSVMKLALLDKYLNGQDQSVLVCNRIKENIFLERNDLWDIDPYAVMFRDVFEHYGETGQQDARNLMRLAFMQKTGLLLATHCTGRFYEMQSYSFLEFFFPYSEASIASHIEPNRSEPVETDKSKGPFAELVELGDQMIRFMFKTYAAIQAMLGEHEVGAMVTREDLTKIGRKVFSYLRPRPNKIMRLPFLENTVELFAGLEFAAETAPGRPPIWIVRGEPHKRLGRKLAKEEIRRAKSLEELLVWMTANEVFHPQIPLKASQMDKFTSLPDISAALTALRETFPAQATFDTDINHNLQPEQAVKALLLINLCVPREDRQFRRVALVYSTNWGELFCVTQPKALERLRQTGYDFVRANVGRVGPDMEVRVFTPARALCPQVLV